MTLVRTTPGWLYLAVVLNLYSRADAPPHAAGLGVRRVGDDRRMPTAERRGAAALGSWSAYAYLALLGDIESRPAIHVQGLLGNAAIEGFFRPLKAERVFLTLYTSHHWAKTDLFDYVRFYNHRRPHSTLGYLSPMDFERRNASSSS
jgi:putative transposase